MPLFKINNPEVRNFLLKYIQRNSADQLTSRTNYLPKRYEEALNKIRILRKKENISVSMYETIDTSGKNADSFVIGVLKSNQKLSEN
jgi:hypothetical protein